MNVIATADGTIDRTDDAAKRETGTRCPLSTRKPCEAGRGFQLGQTEELRRLLETRSALRVVKNVANLVLGATGTGDTIVVRGKK